MMRPEIDGRLAERVREIAAMLTEDGMQLVGGDLGVVPVEEQRRVLNIAADVFEEYIMAAGWRPIETAPKDGAPVLIFQPWAGFAGNSRSHHMPVGALRDGEYSYSYTDPRLQWYDDARWAIGYWRPWGGWGNRNAHTVQPTHWIPLPPPPANGSSEDGER